MQQTKSPSVPRGFFFFCAPSAREVRRWSAARRDLEAGGEKRRFRLRVALLRALAVAPVHRAIEASVARRHLETAVVRKVARTPGHLLAQIEEAGRAPHALVHHHQAG